MAKKSPAKMLRLLWDFSRPHTLVGTLFSITSLFYLACYPSGPASLNGAGICFAYTLISCLCCNIYITGLNQWADSDLDRINKPWLPIPAGRMGRDRALIICLICLAGAIVFSLLASTWLFWLILIIAAIGTAYSLPPVKFKKHHLGAALAILLVRGLLVNVGVFVHFRIVLNDIADFPAYMWPLTVFITLFSVAIAWYKDIPDAEGDAGFNIRTLTLRLSPQKVFITATMLIVMAYMLTAGNFFFGWFTHTNPYLAVYHFVIPALFIREARKTKPGIPSSMHRFYMFFWVFFFLEYLVYPAGLYLADL